MHAKCSTAFIGIWDSVIMELLLMCNVYNICMHWTRRFTMCPASTCCSCFDSLMWRLRVIRSARLPYSPLNCSLCYVQWFGRLSSVCLQGIFHQQRTAKDRINTSFDMIWYYMRYFAMQCMAHASHPCNQATAWLYRRFSLVFQANIRPQYYLHSLKQKRPLTGPVVVVCLRNQTKVTNTKGASHYYGPKVHTLSWRLFTNLSVTLHLFHVHGFFHVMRARRKPTAGCGPVRVDGRLVCVRILRDKSPSAWAQSMCSHMHARVHLRSCTRENGNCKIDVYVTRMAQTRARANALSMGLNDL